MKQRFWSRPPGWLSLHLSIWRTGDVVVADDDKVMIGLANNCLVVAVAMACLLAALPTGGTRLVCHCDRGMFLVWRDRYTGVGVVISIVTSGREVVARNCHVPTPLSVPAGIPLAEEMYVWLAFIALFAGAGDETGSCLTGVGRRRAVRR